MEGRHQVGETYSIALDIVSVDSGMPPEHCLSFFAA